MAAAPVLCSVRQPSLARWGIGLHLGRRSLATGTAVGASQHCPATASQPRRAGRRQVNTAFAFRREAKRAFSSDWGRRTELYDEDTFVPIDEEPIQIARRRQKEQVIVHSPPPLPDQADTPARASSAATSPPSPAPPSPSMPSQDRYASGSFGGQEPSTASSSFAAQDTSRSFGGHGGIPAGAPDTSRSFGAHGGSPAGGSGQDVASSFGGHDQDRHHPSRSSAGGQQDSWSVPAGSSDVAGGNLQTLDWDQESLVTFQKSFYQEHPEVAALTTEQCQAILQRHQATLECQHPAPKPLDKFEHTGFDRGILEYLRDSGFAAPTSIQAVGWPVALSGHDMIGLAQTGSGKTLAYLLPALVHIAAQPKLRPGDGPIALVLAPTRELAVQIQMEAFQLGEVTGLSEAVLYGGVARGGQVQALRRGVELVIATPGRLLDLLQGGVTNLKRITYLVVDEADRMLDMGFEPQLRRIISQIRPDRQTLMWSATWPREIQHLARDICREDPVKVSIGRTQSQANPDIKQDIRVCSEIDKRGRFFDFLREVCPPHGQQPRVLVFVETKKAADALARELKHEQFPANALHGDRTQKERDSIVHQFRTGQTSILIATDVAQRGLDIKDVRYVVNYDVPKTIEDYVHRIGRTGRAGAEGTAVTFFGFDFPTPQRSRMARDIINIMRGAGQEPPAELERITQRR